jgi:hypothetical protein
MKKFKLILIVFALAAITASVNTSCEDLTCNGKGTLRLTNDSHSTVQKVMINGVNYGTLDPDESKDFELSPGMYTWQLVGISGGTGCSAAVVTITECDTQGFSCGAK